MTILTFCYMVLTDTCSTRKNENVTETTLAGPLLKRRRLQSQHMDISSNTEGMECYSSQSTECSQGTETEYSISSQASSASSSVKTSRLECLNNFLSVCGLSPVQELRNTLSESSSRTKQRYISKARQCIDVLLDTICPNEGNTLWKSLINEPHDQEPSQHTNILKEIYLNADTWQFKRQILSILTQQMTFDETQNALDKVPGAFKVKVVDGVYDLDIDKIKTSIPNISNFYNFAFEDEGIRMWQAFGIGEGHLIKWMDLNPSKNHVHLKNVSNWKESNEARNFSCNDQTQQEKDQAQYFCPKDGCIKEFKNQSSLDQHLLLGSCDLRLEREPLTDRVKSIYASKLSEIGSKCTAMKTKESAQNVDEDKLPIGWAFKTKKKKTVFTQAQKDFMTEKFNIGKRGGCKVDPFTAAEEMQTGQRFNRSEFLTGQQIASFFSRLAQQDKKVDQHDFRAAQEQESKCKLKKEILEFIEQ